MHHAWVGVYLIIPMNEDFSNWTPAVSNQSKSYYLQMMNRTRKCKKKDT